MEDPSSPRLPKRKLHFGSNERSSSPAGVSGFRTPKKIRRLEKKFSEKTVLERATSDSPISSLESFLSSPESSPEKEKEGEPAKGEVKAQGRAAISQAKEKEGEPAKGGKVRAKGDESREKEGNAKEKEKKGEHVIFLFRWKAATLCSSDKSSSILFAVANCNCKTSLRASHDFERKFTEKILCFVRWELLLLQRERGKIKAGFT